MNGNTAVVMARTGSPRANLLTVLSVVGNSPNDSYTGTLFYDIFGRNTWSLAMVTLGSWTKLASWFVTPDLIYYTSSTANVRRDCTMKRLIFTFCGCSKSLWRIQSCGVIIVPGLAISSPYWGCSLTRWLLSLCGRDRLRSRSARMTIMIWQSKMPLWKSFFLITA